MYWHAVATAPHVVAESVGEDAGLKTKIVEGVVALGAAGTVTVMRDALTMVTEGAGVSSAMFVLLPK